MRAILFNANTTHNRATSRCCRLAITEARSLFAQRFSSVLGDPRPLLFGAHHHLQLLLIQYAVEGLAIAPHPILSWAALKRDTVII